MITAEVIFKAVVRLLISKDIYPGPTILNQIVHHRDSRSINGRECQWRREQMAEQGVPLKRPFR